MNTDIRSSDEVTLHYDLYYLDIDMDNGVVDIIRDHTHSPVVTRPLPDGYRGGYDVDLDLWADEQGFTVLWNTQTDSNYGVTFEAEPNT